MPSKHPKGFLETCVCVCPVAFTNTCARDALLLPIPPFIKMPRANPRKKNNYARDLPLGNMARSTTRRNQLTRETESENPRGVHFSLKRCQRSSKINYVNPGPSIPKHSTVPPKNSKISPAYLDTTSIDSELYRPNPLKTRPRPLFCGFSSLPGLCSMI